MRETHCESCKGTYFGKAQMQLGLQRQPVRKSQASGMPLGRPLRVGVGGAEDVFVAPHQGKHAALPL